MDLHSFDLRKWMWMVIGTYIKISMDSHLRQRLTKYVLFKCFKYFYFTKNTFLQMQVLSQFCKYFLITACTYFQPKVDL